MNPEFKEMLTLFYKKDLDQEIKFTSDEFKTLVLNLVTAANLDSSIMKICERQIETDKHNQI